MRYRSCIMMWNQNLQIWRNCRIRAILSRKWEMRKTLWFRRARVLTGQCRPAATMSASWPTPSTIQPLQMEQPTHHCSTPSTKWPSQTIQTASQSTLRPKMARWHHFNFQKYHIHQVKNKTLIIATLLITQRRGSNRCPWGTWMAWTTKINMFRGSRSSGLEPAWATLLWSHKLTMTTKHHT